MCLDLRRECRYKFPVSNGIKPRLAAVLAADVVGYSKLMSSDQAATLDGLRRLRGELFTPTVKQFGGETVKSMGDGWIVTFASVNEAAQFAIRIQEGLSAFPMFQLRITVDEHALISMTRKMIENQISVIWILLN